MLKKEIKLILSKVAKNKFGDFQPKAMVLAPVIIRGKIVGCIKVSNYLFNFFLFIAYKNFS